MTPTKRSWMTPRSKELYLVNNGTLCPYCHSDNLEARTSDYGEGHHYQNVICLSCRKEWTDEYTLTNILPEEET